MVKIGLTGNRYSGKNTVCGFFNKMHIPVFSADVVLKFLLNHNVEVKDKVREAFGDKIYGFSDGLLRFEKITSDSEFNGLVDIVDFEMRKSYEKFRLSHMKSIYTIFHSSILFETGWNVYMDYSINVFCPKKERIERGMMLSHNSSSKVKELLKNEMDDATKNGLADYIIHNYETSEYTCVIDQVSRIDQKLVDKYIETKSETVKIL